MGGAAHSGTSERRQWRAHFSGSDVFYAWLAATVLSGLPSTLYALITGGDALEATRAAGAMLLPAQSTLPKLILAAAAVHVTVSLFWTVVLALTLPHRHVTLWAIAAAVAIAIFDLRLIAPAFFPEVEALAFWPQFADHVMWGACFGGVLAYRRAGRRG